jgi:hypothetical protein
MKNTKSLYDGHRFPAVVIGCAVRRCSVYRRRSRWNRYFHLERSSNTVYINSTGYIYRVGNMEHLIRILNDKDRRTLAWLREQVGEAALGAAAERCGGPTKPYVSRVCRCLGLRPPIFGESRPHISTATAERSLASIREILAAAAARRGPGSVHV